MRFKRIFSTIDTHTAGEPTRTVLGGLPPIPGKSMSEKMLYLKEKQDWIRKTLMFEPRGNSVMSGVFLTEPCDPQADIGVIFIEVGGYLPMCGHDTIGVSTTLIEAGIVEPKEPVTNITLDTPAGLVKVKVRVEDNVAKEVSFTNVPAFLFAKEEEIEVEGFGKVKMDIAYGGNYYVMIPAEKFGLKLEPQNGGKIIEIGNIIKNTVNEQIEVYHPEKPFIDEVTHVMFCGEPDLEGSDAKNAVVIPPGSVDRSPCGTGTSARVAMLYSKGKLDMDRTFVHESITNTIFKAKILKETKVGKFDAVVVEVTGSAYVIGINQWVIDPDDPIPHGYFLS